MLVCMCTILFYLFCLNTEFENESKRERERERERNSNSRTLFHKDWRERKRERDGVKTMSIVPSHLAITGVSSWILTSRQPHRVTSGRSPWIEAVGFRMQLSRVKFPQLKFAEKSFALFGNEKRSFCVSASTNLPTQSRKWLTDSLSWQTDNV